MQNKAMLQPGGMRIGLAQVHPFKADHLPTSLLHGKTSQNTNMMNTLSAYKWSLFEHSFPAAKPCWCMYACTRINLTHQPVLLVPDVVGMVMVVDDDSFVEHKISLLYALQTAFATDLEHSAFVYGHLRR